MLMFGTGRRQVQGHLVHGREPGQARPKSGHARGPGAGEWACRARPRPAPYACDPSGAGSLQGALAQQQRLTRVGHGAVFSEVQVARIRLQRHARLWEGEQQGHAALSNVWEDAGAGAESLPLAPHPAAARRTPRGPRQRQHRRVGRHAAGRCVDRTTPSSCTCLPAGCRQATCTAGRADERVRTCDAARQHI